MTDTTQSRSLNIKIMAVYFKIVDYTMANIEKLLIRLLRYKLKDDTIY